MKNYKTLHPLFFYQNIAIASHLPVLFANKDVRNVAVSSAKNVLTYDICWIYNKALVVEILL